MLDPSGRWNGTEGWGLLPGTVLSMYPYRQDVKNSDVLYGGVFICLGMIIQHCDT